MADLTDLLEDEAVRKADGERRTRRNLPSACDNDVRGNNTNISSSCGGGGSGGPIPSSELRRFGKKLEEAVRSREHAAEVTQRLAKTDKKLLPRNSKRVSVISSSLRSTGGAVIGGKEGVRSKGWAAPPVRGGGAYADEIDGKGYRSGRNRPSLKSASGCLRGRAGSDELELRSHRDPSRAAKTLTVRADSGSDTVEEDLQSMAAAAAAAMRQATRQSGGRGRERGVLASKLRGAVRSSRDQAVDDEKFWN